MHRHATTTAAALAAALALLLAGATPARAQYRNAGIGLDGGALGTQRLDLGPGPALGVESQVFLGSGFELVFRGLVSLHGERGAGAGSTATGLVPAAGVRFLTTEELLRPYVGAMLETLFFFGAATPPPLVGASGFAGLEYYVGTNVAIGLQLEYHHALTTSGAAVGALGRVLWGF